MKNLLIVGGYGQLGRVIVKTFKKFNPLWKVMNIDLNVNKDADYNITLKSNLDSKEVKSIQNDCERYLGKENKLNCVINVAGGWQGGSVEDNDIIEALNSMMSRNLYSSVLAA